MKRKLTLFLAAAAIAVSTLSIDAITAPSAAGKLVCCYYFARDTSNELSILWRDIEKEVWLVRRHTTDACAKSGGLPGQESSGVLPSAAESARGSSRFQCLGLLSNTWV